ncbi:UDP-N-acetylmuramate--alanine ligase, partial [Salmonella enterica subsp. enterica serovar Typhimurium]
MNTQQ